MEPHESNKRYITDVYMPGHGTMRYEILADTVIDKGVSLFFYQRLKNNTNILVKALPATKTIIETVIYPEKTNI
jgi:hypothetical protein